MISYKKFVVCLLFAQQVYASENPVVEDPKSIKNSMFTHEVNTVPSDTSLIFNQQQSQHNQPSIYDAFSSGQMAAQSALWSLMSMSAANVANAGQRLYATGA